MNGFFTQPRRSYRWVLLAFGAVGITTLLALLPASAFAGSGPGSWSQAQVNQAIANGVGYFDANQNSDGSWGTFYFGASTALALGSYGVLDGGKFSNLSPAQQTRVTNGLKYLLSTQGTDGSFNADGAQTYDTGLALIALSLNTDNPTYQAQIATATTNARNWLIANQNIPANGINCSFTGGADFNGDQYCGGWNYGGATLRSDESNTGFALTGLDVTGGVPTTVAAANVGWQRNVQNLDVPGGSTNFGGFTARNDGGGSYTPDFTGTGGCCAYVSSNANDTGSLIFGLGYDKVPATDPAVQAAVKFGNDVLDTYEANKATPTMIYHTGQNEDGSCVIGNAGCDWQFGPSNEGGYHYSIFALVKGLSQYGGPSLTDPNNFYAKAVDLLLSQQQSDGSWPQDGRDDGNIAAATGFAVLALGKVGSLEQPISASGMTIKPTEGKSFSGGVATVNDPDATASPSEYTATINWGDGTTSSGTLSGTNGNFTVNGTHTYAEEGTYTIKVTVTDTDDTSNSARATSSAKVADASLSASGVTPSRSGNSVSGKVASFTDADPGGKVSDYTAAITWGDGSMSAGTISASSGKFAVSGSHRYSKSGTYNVTITIKDIGGSTATAKTTVTIPAQQVKAARVSARLSNAPACVSRAFVSRVSGNRIASVRFTLDGRQQRTRTVRRGSQYAARIAVSAGRHSLTVKVKFRSGSSARSRTFHRTVRGCPPPMFTG